MSERCAHCGEPVRMFNFALGPKLLHYTPGASFPSTQRGTAWEFCKLQAAALAPVPASGSDT